METETIHYQCNGVDLTGYLAYTDNSRAKRPAIIIAHAWRGQDDFAREKARELAELGYVGFAADLYGNATHADNNEDAQKLMLPLFLNRQLLRDRISAAIDAIKTHPLVNEEAIGAIGFCFGGLAVIELLRSGAPIRGAVSFHGVLGYNFGDYKAQKIPNADNINGSLLMLHGYKDPFVKPEEIQAIQKEFSEAGVNWQMNIYSDAMHAFTNPLSNEPEKGMQYHQETAYRAWQAMCNFFDDIFPS